jgi:hypothetical protein
MPDGLAKREGAPAIELQLLTLLRLLLAGRAALVAENLFLRKQLALVQERKVRPRKASATAKLSLIVLARLFHSPGRPGSRPARDLPRLAPPGVPRILALEVPEARPPAVAPKPA